MLVLLLETCGNIAWKRIETSHHWNHWLAMTIKGEHSSVSFHHICNCDFHQPRYDTTVRVACAKMCKVFPKTCRPCCKYKAVAVSYSLPLGASSEWDSLVSPARGGLMVIFRGKLLHMEANGATVINSTAESEWIELETNYIYSVHLLMTNKSIYIYIYIGTHIYIYYLLHQKTYAVYRCKYNDM